MNIEAAHTPSDNTQGWLRLAVMVVTWVTTLALGFGSMKANLEAQAVATHELSLKFDKLADSFNAIAISNEGLRHDVTDVKQSTSEIKNRVDRIESDRRKP